MSMVPKTDGPLTIERLREVAIYDDETGDFFARIQRGRVKVGDALGRIRDDGYIIIGIDNHTYLAHRLVMFWHSGRWPQGDVDHANGDVSWNLFHNLREADRSQNLANARRPKSNTSGFKGVAWHRRAGKWRAEISLNRVRTYLGLFDRAEDAHAAYMAAAQSHYGSFARSA